MAISQLTPLKPQNTWISIRRPATIRSWLESTKPELTAFAFAWRGKAQHALQHSPPKRTNGCYSWITNERKNEAGHRGQSCTFFEFVLAKKVRTDPDATYYNE